MSDNPYQPPEASSPAPQSGLPLRVLIGRVVLGLGIAVSAYGALAFWVMKALPPNNPIEGRLPSLYVIFAGMGAMLVGLAFRTSRMK